MQFRIPLILRGRAPHASSAERFENPLPVPCRIAVISPHFEESDAVRSFDEAQVFEIKKFCPEILAGTVAVLLRLAPSLRISKAIVAFSGVRLGPLTHHHRDLLWSAYQVPIFEQSLAADGSVVARECEAHQGLHVYAGTLMASASPIPCPCGRPQPRLL